MANIMIVDDQPYLEEWLLQDFLNEAHEIRSVRRGDRLMKEFRRFQPDIVLLDLYLQGFEGWELLDQIKAESPDTPVIIVTAYDTFRDEPRAARADGYILKSFDTEALRTKIHEKLNAA